MAMPITTVPAELDGEPLTSEHAAALGPVSYGHFSAMVVDDLRVQGLARHLERLVRDCAVVFGAVLDPERVRALLERVAAQCDRPTMLRATVLDAAASVARPGLTGADPGAQPNVLVSTRAVAPRVPSPGLRVRTTSFVRDLPAVKHLGTFGQLHQRRLAQLAGFDDALCFTGPEPEARVTEGPTWNIAVLIGDELIWPDDDCLPGITRDLLHQVFRPAGVGGVSGADVSGAGGDGAVAAGVGWAVRSVTRAELAGARAAFATSTGVGVLPIAQIDGTFLPGDPHLLEELQAGYAQLPGDPLTSP